MLGLRAPELLIIGFIVLLMFGPGKLAGLGKGLGEGIRGFKKAMEGGEDEKTDAQAAALPSAKPGSGDGSRA
jgi:sec-independent protein translocase protein TatA